MKKHQGEYNHKAQTLEIGRRTAKVVSVENTEHKYPSIFKHGTVRIFTVKMGETIYTAYEYSSGLFSDLKRAF